MQKSEKIIDQFRKSGLRVTPQRRLIIKLLAGDHSHPTVEDIYQQIKPRMPDVSLATVYNTLHELVAMGELMQVDGHGCNRTRYDTNTTQHHHLYCEKCHQLVDIESNLGEVRFPKEDFSDYLIKRSQVIFYGICPKCQGEIK